MKYNVRLSGIKKHLRDSYSIPASFLAFAEFARTAKYGSVGFFSIGYDNPAPIANLRPEAREFLTTIMSLGDGSLVVLWFESSRKPLVVGLGSEGQHSVIANSLPELLARIRNSTTGFEDLDARDGNEESSFPRIRGVPLKVTATKRANTRFAKWLSGMERTSKFANGTSGTRISQRLVEILGPHMDEDDFSRDLIVTLTDKVQRIQWYDGGLKDCPEADRLIPVLTELSRQLKTVLRKDEVAVTPEGKVYINGDTVDC